jgi:curved DNA-binding protein CbpA
VAGESNPYLVLGVRSDASPHDIATAYRALARQHHPDVSQDADAERRMAEINAAWSTLRDPIRRKAWDRQHAVDVAAAAKAKVESGTWHRGPAGVGAAGPPPGNPRGSVLTFGRHVGWSLGEVARVDPGYLQWLATTRDGARYRDEIDAILANIRQRAEQSSAPTKRRGLFG